MKKSILILVFSVFVFRGAESEAKGFARALLSSLKKYKAGNLVASSVELENALDTLKKDILVKMTNSIKLRKWKTSVDSFSFTLFPVEVRCVVSLERGKRRAKVVFTTESSEVEDVNLTMNSPIYQSLIKQNRKMSVSVKSFDYGNYAVLVKGNRKKIMWVYGVGAVLIEGNRRDVDNIFKGISFFHLKTLFSE